MVTIATSPYLQGNFSPVQAEITVNNLPIIGELPSDLCGTFVRNGPNPQFSPIGRYNWMDGDGMLHSIKISDGKASYCNRYVQTRGFKIEQRAGRATWTGLTEPPQLNNPANNLFSPFKNTANTGVLWHAGRLFALWEGGEPYEIELSQLQTIGPYTYHGQLKSPFTAHPKVDLTTGEMMFFGDSLLQPPYLQYSVVSAAGKIVKTVPIDLSVGVMMHDFAITENYTIFMDLPLTFRVDRLQKRQPGYMFEPDAPSRIGILPRHGDSKSIRWFDVSTCYVVHTLNAYETGDEVVLLACRAKDAKALNIPNKTKVNHSLEDRPILYMWRLNLRTGAVKEEVLDYVAAEFPTVNQRCLGKSNRYGYTARMLSQALPDFTFDGLLKYDFTSGDSQFHEFGLGRYGGEAVFVPRPDGVEEDDGWLLTFVYDGAKKTSELIVVNAQDFRGEPIARILLPQRVPYGFHGTWIADKF